MLIYYLKKIIELFNKAMAESWTFCFRFGQLLGLSNHIINIIIKILKTLMMIWIIMNIIVLFIKTFTYFFASVIENKKEYQMFKLMCPDITKSEFIKLRKSYMKKCAHEEEQKKKRLAIIKAECAARKIKEEEKRIEERLKNLKEMYDHHKF